MFSETADLYDAVYAFKDYPAEAAALRRRVAGAGGRGAGTLLDVACGTGKHLEALAPFYTVEGTDLDAGLLAVARRRLPDVPLHLADMREFDLGKRFDVVTCLFSAIGYAVTVDAMRASVAAMARHLEPGGVLAVEPWFAPDDFRAGTTHLLAVDEPELKIARMSTSSREGRRATLHFRYLVGRPGRVTDAAEDHVTGLFTHDEMLDAFAAAGLRTTHDAHGLTGRGLYLGVCEA